MADETAVSEGIIQVMSERLANQIAAGEVVQRPASVVKELMENALDAGADSIEVVLKEAGSTLVQVIDNGCGMSAEDAERCFKRHATSKVRSINDLERLRTLGFRGEALASIAAVAQVTLKTKRVEDAAGTQVRVEGGEHIDTRPCPLADGTSVAVRNLFYNVPARRNFLKTPATELKHASETVQSLALANPGTAVRLVHDGHEHYDLPAAAGAKDWHAATRTRILDLLGTDHRDELVPVQDASSDLTVRGFVGAPSFHRKTRGEQFLFVNGRYIQDRYLSHAVKTAYDDLVPEGAFPFFALFLTMKPRRVDVNVHPQKSEVKFDDQSGIYGFLRGAVRGALGQTHVTPQMDSPPNEDDGKVAKKGKASGATSAPPSFQPRSPSREDPSATDGASSSGDGSSSGGGRPVRSGRQTERARPTPPPGDQSKTLYRPPEASRPPPAPLTPDDEAGPEREAPAQPDADGVPPAPEADEGRPVWGLHDTYILTPTDTGVMIVDQRAAHVRVLYEQAQAHLDTQRGESQRLLFPHTLDLSPADIELLGELREDLEALGFELERLSGRTVSVRGVPAEVPEGDEGAILEALLDQYTSAQDALDDERRTDLATAMAQRSAVQRGQALSAAERRALLQDLFACEMPYADPTGTPTLMKLSLEELADRFGR